MVKLEELPKKETGGNGRGPYAFYDPADFGDGPVQSWRHRHITLRAFPHPLG